MLPSIRQLRKIVRYRPMMVSSGTAPGVNRRGRRNRQLKVYEEVFRLNGMMENRCMLLFNKIQKSNMFITSVT